QSSPNVHPVFGAAIARQLASFWLLMHRPQRFDIFEAAAGSGRLATDILRALQIESPDLFEVVRYVVQDVMYDSSAAIERLERAGLPVTKVELAKGLPEAQTIEGCILSNELLDAIPFEHIIVRDGKLRRLMVALDHGRFVDMVADPTPEIEAYFDALS